MSESPPIWRQGYDTVERRLGPSLTAVARSEQFAIGVGLAAQVQRAVQKRAARSTRRLLHSLNLPAGTDVSRLLAEIGELKKQVRQLSQQLEKATADGSTSEVAASGAVARSSSARKAASTQSRTRSPARSPARGSARSGATAKKTKSSGAARA